MQSVYGTTKIYPKVFEAPEFHKYHKYFDRILFTILSQIDLTVGLKYLYFTGYNNHVVEAKYFARMVALSCYEILNNTDKILGKEMNDYILIRMGDDALRSMKGLLKQLREIKKKHNSLCTT